jgi:hypothetical protein
MKQLVNLILIVALTGGAWTLSCSDSESRIPSAGDATVIINLGLPPDDDAASASVIDRMLRFFSRDAVAATAPATFGNINIRVTGAGIGSIAKDFPSTGVISMTVPGGGLRTFEVTAQVAAGDPSAALTFYGSTIANVPSGGTVSVPVLMEINETKIVVPDLRKQRLVLLDNVSSAGWNSTITTSQLGTITGGFFPFDIDYDSRGRIYIANWSTNTDIIRMDDLNGTNLTQFDVGSTTITNVIGIAIDRKRDLLYCISSTELYRCPLSNISGGATRLDTVNNILSNLYGIDVDDDGNLYIVNGYSGNYRITKYNPNNAATGIIYQLAFPSLNWGYDIKVEKPYLYVLNTNGSNGATSKEGYQVLKYRIDAEGTGSATYTLVEHFGNKTALANLTAGMFYGPRKFVGIRNDGLFIIDNNETSYLCKMIWTGTEPSLGSGWSSFGAYDTGPSTGYFKFYCSC